MTKKQNFLLFGLVLVVGWAIVLGATTWLRDMPCVLNPSNCSAGRGLAQVILFAPLIVGSGLISGGLFYGINDEKFPRPLQVLAGVVVTGIILFFALWTIISIGLSIHGIDG